MQHTYWKLHGGGFHCSGWPSIQSDQILTLGRSSRRSVGKLDTRTMGSTSLSTSSNGIGSDTHRQTSFHSVLLLNLLPQMHTLYNAKKEICFVCLGTYSDFKTLSGYCLKFDLDIGIFRIYDHWSPAGVSLRSSVQRCTSSPNMAKPREVDCSSNTERASSCPFPEKDKPMQKVRKKGHNHLNADVHS